MGAQQFWTEAQGKTPAEAFESARDEALYEYGHGGYTGTIAEKSDFVVIAPPVGVTARDYAEALMSGERVPEGYPPTKFKKDFALIDDKWGSAGCVKVGDGSYLFFGWASS